MTAAEEKRVYHRFVPDQVLTSDNLNNQFAYLDNQQRQTRTQLVGTGIVCGLEVKTVTTGNNSSIKITKGVGITSAGYLVQVPLPEKVYTKRTSGEFNAVQSEYYDKFVNSSAASNTKRFQLWELKQESDTNETEPLTTDFLQDKVVLLFVELLEENNKNCDPSSCDEKGTKVTVSIKPLLARADDVNVQQYILNASGSIPTGKAVLLPEIRMKRFDVPASGLAAAEDIYAAYTAVLTPVFITGVKTKLNEAYGKLSSVLSTDFNGNEFNELVTRFAFLQNTPVLRSTQLRIQYYYDFFSDLLLAYEELKQKAYDLLCDCVPDETLFPRHLLLGEALGFNENTTLNRTRFIPSCAVSCCNGAAEEIDFLYQRLVLMVRNFSEPPFDNSTTRPVKITPSVTGIHPLSARAIPFYYNPATGTKQLYLNWSVQRKLHGTSQQILSYNSQAYNPAPLVLPDPLVESAVQPLLYDLEPYNFFRIEGHIGLDYEEALDKVQDAIQRNRVPVKVVLLKTGTVNLEGNVLPEEVRNVTTGLEVEYALILKEWKVISATATSILQRETEYFGFLPANDPRRTALRTALNNIKGLGSTNLPDTFFDFLKTRADFNLKKQTAYTQAQSQRVVTMTFANTRSADDITDFFDDLLQLSDNNALDILYNEFLKRSLNFYSNIYLAYFLNKHPGIQHKAGVTTGGTFIMLYEGDSSTTQTGTTTGPFVLTGRVTNASFIFGIGITIRIKNSSIATITDANGNFRLTVQSLPVTIEVSGFFGTGSFEKSITTVDEARGSILINFDRRTITLTGSGTTNNNRIRSGTVIADFYLPYTCCSDGTPVQFIIQRPEKKKCDLPCQGITETTQFAWPTSTKFIDELMQKNRNYSFWVVEYVLNGKSLLTNGPLPIEVNINDDMGGIGNQMIFEAINVNFPTGLVFNLSEKNFRDYDIPFTIKRFQCHSFRFVIVDRDRLPTRENTIYTYTEKGMLVNGDPFLYPERERVNTTIFDECFDSKEAPCQDKQLACDYKWPQKDEEVTAILRNGGLYHFTIYNYKVGQQQLVTEDKPDRHFVSFPPNTLAGLKEVMNYINEHYVTIEALQFAYNSSTGNDQDVITITKYECQDFVFEFGMDILEGGRRVFTQQGTFTKNANGVLEPIMAVANCTNS